MQHKHGGTLALAAAAALALMAVGCGESGRPTEPTATPKADPSPQVAATDRQESALALLTRGLALALGNPGLRERMAVQMRASGVTREFKVPVGAFARSQGQAALANAAARALGITRDSLMTLLTVVDNFEFYMPSATHRREWRLGPVLVASQLHKGDSLLAFDASGTAVAVSTRRTPATPTFVLVPSETDLTQASFAGSLSARRLPRAMGADVYDPCTDPAALQSCDVPGGGGSSTPKVPAAAPSGVYMIYSELVDAKEPWFRGDPEVEAFTLGPRPGYPAGEISQIRCAGEHAAAPGYFDQNSNSWSGAVMLLSEAEVVYNGYVLGAVDNRAMTVMLYEDDDDSCVIHDDPDRMLSDMLDLGYVLGGGFFLVTTASGPLVGLIDLAFVLNAVAHFTIRLFQTNDDFLGTAVSRSVAPWYTPQLAFVPVTHTLLMQNHAVNGAVRLVYHTVGADTY